jgi:hypothetical protein
LLIGRERAIAIENAPESSHVLGSSMNVLFGRACGALLQPAHTVPIGLLLLLAMALAPRPAAAASGPVPSEASPARHKIQVSDPALGRRILAQGGLLVADYGTFQLYETAGLNPGLLGPAFHGRVRDDCNLLHLNTQVLDTSLPAARGRKRAAGDFAGKRLHLIQFPGPIQPAWRRELAGTGVQILTYLPNNAYLVYADAPSLARLQQASAPPLQWEGPYLDDYKIHPAARTTDARARPRDIGTDLFSIQMVADPVANAVTLPQLRAVAREPFRRRQNLLGYLDVIVRLDAKDLAAVAARPDVISIQPYFAPAKLCERQDQILAGNLAGDAPSGPGYLAWLASVGFTQAQFTASGFLVDLSDSGVDNGTTAPNHPGLYVAGDRNNSSRIAYNRLEATTNHPGSTLAGCDGHGNLDAHIIAGFDDQSAFPHTDPAGYHYGLGVCPFARLGSSVIFDPTDFTYPSYADLQSAAYQDGARISNNSWGTEHPDSFGNYNLYNTDAQTFDALVRDAQPAGCGNPSPGNQPMVIVFSGGNKGPGSGTVTWPSTAKNVITVGCAQNVQLLDGPDGCGVPDAQAATADALYAFSSRGPCQDGRHKPDLLAPGTHVSGGVPQACDPATNGTADSCFTGSGICGSSNSLFYPDGQELFTLASGSSQAAAAVSGACALLRQYFLNQASNPPSPAMTKAYLMNSARYLTAVATNDTLWSDNQGMGELSLGAAFDGLPRCLRDQEPDDLFTNTGPARTFTGSIADTNRPFRVTIAWTDAPGSTIGPAYNNDLDLTVVAGGSLYKGNVFNGPSSAPGGTPDPMNNVENVFLPPGISGSFVVTVTAANIVSDGVPNNGIPLDQDFALVIYNASPTNVAPVLYEQPAGLVVTNGADLTLAAAAAGTPPLAYQWTFQGTNLDGATDALLALTNVQPDRAGSYTLVVSNPVGTATSTVAALVVLVPPAITLQPSNQTVTAGAEVSFTVAASGTEPLGYQWSFGGTDLDGATDSALVLTNVQIPQAGTYSVVVSNAAGSLASTPVSLAVLTPPVLTDLTVSNDGVALSFSSDVGVSYTLEYKESLDALSWTPLPPPVAGTGSTLTLQDTNPPPATRFYRIRCD